MLCAALVAALLCFVLLAAQAQAAESLVGKKVNKGKTQATIEVSGCAADTNSTPRIIIEGTGDGENPVTVQGGDISFGSNQIVSKGDQVKRIANLTDPKVKSVEGITCKAKDVGTKNATDTSGGASGGGVRLTCEQLIKLGQGSGAPAAQYSIEVSQKCEGSANVITDTVPGGTLSDTSGPSPGLLVAGLILAGGGLLVRATLRR